MAEADRPGASPRALSIAAADSLEESRGSEEAGPEDPLPTPALSPLPLIFK